MTLGTPDFVTATDNVVFPGPRGTGKTHLAIGIAIPGCQAGQEVLFATASQWVDRLAAAHRSSALQAELARFESETACLFFQLVSTGYERGSLIGTSNKPSGRWGDVFGDDVVAAAMTNHLVHPPESSHSKETLRTTVAATDD